MEAVKAPPRKKRQSRRDSESTPSYLLPTFRPVQLCTLATTIPTGSNWLFEMKFDGYRAQIAISGSEVRVYKRSVPLHAGSVEFCVDGGRQIAKAAVWPDSVVVVLPGRQIEPGVGQRGEQGLVEQFVP